MRSSLLPLLAVALLGTGFARVRAEPATVHVRWTIHHRDLTATTEMDVPALRESEANAELFPRSAHRPPEYAHQRVRIVVAGRTLFDRALTLDEVRRLGDVDDLHVASDVRGAGERDLTAGGTAILQYRASPPGYRLVHAPAHDQRDFRRSDCDRKGSFELERSASHDGVTARIVQRGASFDCVSQRPDTATFEIASSGRTAFASHLTKTEPERRSLPDVMGALYVTDGPAFVDFRTGAPSIVLTGTTRGVHCCYQTHVFRPTGARTYAETVHEWGNGASYPAVLRDARSGEVVFGSSDDDFAWTYGYANAVEPVQIFAFEGGRFLNVTRGFSAVVRGQAERIWQRTHALLRARKVYAAKPGIIAYVTDMAALGRSAQAWRNVTSACTARECVNELRDARAALRWLNSRSSSRQARR